MNRLRTASTARVNRLRTASTARVNRLRTASTARVNRLRTANPIHSLSRVLPGEAPGRVAHLVEVPEVVTVGVAPDELPGAAPVVGVGEVVVGVAL